MPKKRCDPVLTEDERWYHIRYCGKKCHLCPTDVMVRSGPLKFDGKKFRWFLCDICYGKGWRIPTVSRLGCVYMLLYKNTKTEETAWVDVLEIIKIIPHRSSR